MTVLDYFITNFKEAENLESFKWIYELCNGTLQPTKNVPKESDNFMRRLTMVSKERDRSQTKKIGFTEQESEYLQDFFNQEFKKRDAKNVTTTVNKMFKHVKSQTLRKYLIDGLYGKKALDFKEFSNTISILVKEPAGEEKRLHYLFNIFSQKEDTIKKKALKDFLDIFDLPKDIFGSQATLTKTDFLATVSNIGIVLDPLEQSKPMLQGLIGLNCDEEEQKQAF
jgi:hypothetical protein